MIPHLLFLVSAQFCDTRGPVFSPGRPPTVGREVVTAGQRATAVRPDDKGPELGSWIWSDDSKKDVPVRFRKRLTLAESPKQVKIWITAEARYRLWINGKLAARGPADAGRDYDTPAPGPWFVDVRDLSKLFKKGVNAIAVEVFPTPLVSSDATSGHPGLKASIIVGGKNPLPLGIGTDTSWHAQPALDLDQSDSKNGFRVDLSKEPVAWQSEDYDDSDWLPAALTHQNSRATLVSELPPAMEVEIPSVDSARVSPTVSPNAVGGGARFSGDGAYTLRFGHVLSGYIGMKIEGHKGTVLRIRSNERDAPGWNRQAEIVLREGLQVVDLPYFDSFSVINIEAIGVKEPIEIKDVKCVFTSFPVQYLGDFKCSNPEYNRVWEVCRWVTQICMQTHHLDSPHHQEPISDAGDYLIESLNSFYAFGDGTLARQDLKKIARTLIQRKFQSFHTSYSLLWVRMLLQYVDYTGDIEPLKELSPVVNALMKQFEGYIGENGLISDAPNYMFMDWVEIKGFTAHHPPAVIGQGYMTALYYQALGDAIRLAMLAHNEGNAAHYNDLREQIKRAFDRELWVPKEGLYRDGKPFQTSIKPNSWLPADRDIETFTTQVNTLAVSCGLADPSRTQSIMSKVLSRPDLNCQPYFMHFVFEAMTSSALFTRFGPKQLQRWQIVPDTQSFYEMWGTGDLSHAWNATPMFQMSGRILGVEPTSPGFKVFRIEPHPCGLTWAKGKVPTPHGLISIEWKQSEKALEIHFTVPANTKAVLNGKVFSSGSHSWTIVNYNVS